MPPSDIRPSHWWRIIWRCTPGYTSKPLPNVSLSRLSSSLSPLSQPVPFPRSKNNPSPSPTSSRTRQPHHKVTPRLQTWDTKGVCQRVVEAPLHFNLSPLSASLLALFLQPERWESLGRPAGDAGTLVISRTGVH